jgi:glycosyltransferase involved in cell wall biosynthesis
MKILVTAPQVRLDTTSEGICTAKFLTAVAGAGHQVVCLTADRVLRSAAGPVCPWLPDITMWHRDDFPAAGWWPRTSQIATRLAESGAVGASIDRKGNALAAYLTGYSSHVWSEVERWRSAIQHAVHLAKPDVIVTRAAGTRFDPHVAMSDMRLGIPWIANYHDPFPASLYPPSYRLYAPFMSGLQERIHRRIVRSAHALTFPSERLLHWVLRDQLKEHQRKAFVVSHIGGGIEGTEAGSAEPAPDSRMFSVVHTGTLLHQRNPQPLLRAFLRFMDEHRASHGHARLVFVGRVHRDHVALPEWAALDALGAVQRLEDRVPYDAAVAIARDAAALVVLEADDEESPFFPAKLADYLWLNRPILALSPRKSTTADLLGRDYPLLSTPADVDRIAGSLAALWRGWSDGDLAQFLPHRAVADSCGAPAVQAQFDRVLEFSCRVPGTAAAPITDLRSTDPVVRPSEQ